MAILTASQTAPTIAGIPPLGSSATNTSATSTTNTSSADTELPSYQFIVGWILLIALLTAAAQTRLGYVAIYYSLVLMILLILVTEYQQLVPLLNFETIGQLNTSKSV